MLRAEGYDIGFFGEMDFYAHLRKGLDAVDVGIYPAPDAHHVARLNAWMGRHATRPFAAWIHLVGPHLIGEVGKESLKLFPQASRVRFEDMLAMHSRETCAPECLRTERKEELIAYYDAKVRTADNYLSVILKTVAKLGLEGKTVVIVSADHG